MRKQFFYSLLSTCLLLLCTAQAFATPTFTKIYFFGDSLTDVGNYVKTSSFIPDEMDQNAPVTNWIQNLGATPSKTTWAEFFAEHFGLHAYAKNNTPNSTENDFAVAGNTTKDVYHQQLPQFLNEIDKAAPPNPATTLYVIWAGANDIRENVPPSQSMSTIAGTIVTLHNYTYTYQGKTEKLAASNFLIISIPDMSLTPLVQNCAHAAPLAYCQKVYAELHYGTPQWNQGILEHTINFFHQKYGNQMHFYYYKTAEIFESVTSNPGQYGFQTSFPDLTAMGACKNIEGGTTCTNSQVEWYRATYTDAYSGKVFNNPDKFIFYNAIHPTTRTHKILANDIWEQCFNRGTATHKDRCEVLS